MLRPGDAGAVFITVTDTTTQNAVTPVEATTFASLSLAEPLLRALERMNFTVPTPIQAGAIPSVMAGRDLLGIAQTGTGKTGGFLLPILHQLIENPKRTRRHGTRVLILAPTRELAQQIEADCRKFSAELRMRIVSILGGVGRQPQVDRMAPGVDVVVGTPGRICDLMETNHLKLDEVEHFVLDEADRMLDLGFIHDIRRIMALLPQKRQSLLFSATMPGEIGRLANSLLREPVKVEITPSEPTPNRIEQHVHFVNQSDKRMLLSDLLADQAMSRVIIFTRTKHGADRVAEHLVHNGVDAEALHGNKSQSARVRSLDRFRSGRARVLVATDIAARGIDVPQITHVVNFDLPNEPESYVHRIGRTARAGHAGIAISFCDPSERPFLRSIERLTKVPLQPAGPVPQPAERATLAPRKPAHVDPRSKQGFGGGRDEQGNRPRRSFKPRNDGGRQRSAA